MRNPPNSKDETAVLNFLERYCLAFYLNEGYNPGYLKDIGISNLVDHGSYYILDFVGDYIPPKDDEYEGLSESITIQKSDLLNWITTVGI
jgi:hypothetical protein